MTQRVGWKRYGDLVLLVPESMADPELTAKIRKEERDRVERIAADILNRAFSSQGEEPSG